MSYEEDDLKDSILNGFIDQDLWPSITKFEPSLLHNGKGDSLYSHIQNELEQCDSFTFAVAFISESMLVPLKTKMADLAEQGVKGRILTSNYLTFNAPKMFRELLKLPNVDIRISPDQGFHAKGYLFNHKDNDYQTAYIGSSNFTSSALFKNYEWNIRFTSAVNGAITGTIRDEINTEWQRAYPLTNQWIDLYEQDYNAHLTESNIQKISHLQESRVTYVINKKKKNEIQPNQMQKDALQQIEQLRKNNQRRGLVVSATGTGKTYLGAFDVRNYQPKKFLYIVHREQILDKTIKSFKEILGGADSDYGKLGGGNSQTDCRYLFATIQTLANTDWLHRFPCNYFDYILVDEAHKTGAKSYQRVLDYFQPDFLLGMTATPERMDNFNVFELFDYNIAYEIRLQDALEEDMLCPFNYVGVTDYEDSQHQISDERSDLKWLVSDERVKYIIEQTQYYGFSGDVLHGLIFCSRKDEAKELAACLTSQGYTSVALTGETPEKKREQAVEKLEKGEITYLITVDVFNEGIDIPCVNQVVMLRNTQSSIIFIQQLGRGLRKADKKEYLTVIDFIGNYKNNYLIPIALTGDKSRNSDQARDDLEAKTLAGLSTVSFTRLARKLIYDSIAETKLTSMNTLRNDYVALKEKIGRIPLIVDFQKFDGIDSEVFADRRWGNYYQFLLKMKEDVHLTAQENAALTFVTCELMNGKRAPELMLLDKLVQRQQNNDTNGINVEELSELFMQFEVKWNSEIQSSLTNIFKLSFFSDGDQKRYGNNAIIEENDGNYKLSSQLSNELAHDKLFVNLFKDAINAGLSNVKMYDTMQKFTLYKKYTRKDVCRLLNWDKDISSTVYGYRIKDGKCPIFVTYSKSRDIDLGIQYEDRFLSPQIFLWYSRHNRRLESKEIQSVLNDNTDILLFVKKSDAEGSDFFYLGPVSVVLDSVSQEEIKTGIKNEPIVKMNLKLKYPVEYDYYTRITN